VAKRQALIAVWLIGIAAIVASLPLVYRFVRIAILDWDDQPYCHKAIGLALANWQDEHGRTGEFPNVGGRSSDSLAELVPFFGDTGLEKKYRYVPGLTVDDPGDLVLLYLPQATRWTWHGTAPTIFQKKAWILVPVDMKLRGPDRDDAGPGENSERVPLEEFKYRLRKTLDFLAANQRPNWEAVVEEHTRFLEMLADQSN
jgi:hypothetical protein